MKKPPSPAVQIGHDFAKGVVTYLGKLLIAGILIVYVITVFG